MTDGQKVRWGILSTANIGVQKVIPAITVRLATRPGFTPLGE